jgi:2-oxoglutarate dehydrogenase E2 component (dihydrolipoamide succinyltransferase)
MPVELKVPQIGESITEVQIAAWRKKVGEFVQRDEPVVEIESDKATVELPAPVSGTVTQILVQDGEASKVGAVVGYMEPSEAPAKAAPEKKPEPPKAEKATAGKNDSEARVMPSAKRVLAEAGVAASEVKGTGPGGRVVKEDALRQVAARPAPASPPELPGITTAKPSAPAPPPPLPVAPPLLVPAAGARTDTVKPMSPMRKRIAERLVQAQQAAALLTTFNEVDMSAVMALREDHKEDFQKKYGVKLGFMSFFVRAAVDALQLVPAVNAEIRGTDIVYRDYCDIGIAVGSGKGLAVPILRNADKMSFADIEIAIGDFGARAKENKLKIEELQGGTFTISNGGVYGSLLSTPIVNPPQSGILGMHAIQERPIAVNGQVVIRPMMYVAVTYDHRLVDGREAVTFLKRIKECVEKPARLMLGI